jgi:hypothetical protein
MSSDVGVQNAAGVDLHGNEYVQNAESCSDGYEEVAGDRSFRVIAHECGPSQAAGRAAGPRGIEIVCNRSGRDTNAELEREFVGDSLFAPGGVLVGPFVVSTQRYSSAAEGDRDGATSNARTL